LKARHHWIDDAQHVAVKRILADLRRKGPISQQEVLVVYARSAATKARSSAGATGEKSAREKGGVA
jgi:hypothetical protein